jgi:NAD-dependent SIR2 family protein deacetylase
MDDALVSLLAAMAAGRLVVFSGAGLSMPAPSSIPSARVLAEECARRHQSQTGETLPEEVRSDIEAQARLFRSRGKLESYFIETLIDWQRFAGAPNHGHFAIADFLLCEAVDLSVTANVDVLVEIAAGSLGDATFYGCVRGSEAATPREYNPHLKLHGCIRHGVSRTLWCHEQLPEPEWQSRLEESVRWLAGRLTQRDIVFIGYWTDWSYLNDLLSAVLSDQLPRSVTLVDTSPAEALEQKAPELWRWAHRDGIHFQHVQASGDTFLKELRFRYSQLLLRRIAEQGCEAHAATHGAPCPAFPAVDSCTVEDLYDLRRDFAGVRRDEAARQNEAEPANELLGKVFFDLVAAGAILDGSHLTIAGKRVRVFQAAGRMLYTVKDHLAGDTLPALAPDLTVCVGAADDGDAPVNIVRAGRRGSIVRPGLTGDWCTHDRLQEVLGAG